MDRDTARPIVLALLCVLALGLAAATLDTAVQSGDSGGFGVGPPNSDAGAPGGGGSLGVNSSEDSAGAIGPSIEPPCYPVLATWWAIALILGVFSLGAYLAYRRLGGLGVVAYAGPVGIPLLLAHALLTTCAGSIPAKSGGLLRSTNNSSLLPQGGSGAPGTGEGVSLTDPNVLLLAGLGVALAAAVALLFASSSGDDPDPEESVTDPDTETDVAAVGRAAGDAADRIESTEDVDNEVYRAWREMTDHLDVANPRASTPAEFAAAAVDAGMARDDVEELTGVFEAVRYGGEAPTDRREERALAALRNIEAEYAGDADDPDDPDDPPGGRR
ncbi:MULTISPECIES: DUF4129 domain-containing protein [Halorussus]|uniref:DUF4129 domain-containing protein n=1 Tax=Halorussus TaxID=1070314 RepID=UPI0020A02E81|nr:DUF4129 domain-containing protein [Halorussus vallis]USZ74929.1 DUF4129 domain-containing protein [Halorussus vallis]